MADFFEAGITNMVREGLWPKLVVPQNIKRILRLFWGVGLAQNESEIFNSGEILKVFSGENQKEMVFALDKNL